MRKPKPKYAVFDNQGEQLGLDYMELMHAMIAVDELQREAAAAGTPAPRLHIMTIETVPRQVPHAELAKQRPFVRLARAIRELPDGPPDSSWHQAILDACDKIEQRKADQLLELMTKLSTKRRSLEAQRASHLGRRRLPKGRRRK